MAFSNLDADTPKDDGQGLAEYGLILVLVAVVALVATQALGGSVVELLTSVVNKL